MNTKRAPKVRFKGFTDAWELRKLPEFVNFYSGLTYTPDNVQESGTLVLRSSNVKNGEIIDADNVYVNIDIVNSENVQDGDIIVVIRNGSRALIGKHAQIKGFRSNTVIGAFMTGIRSEHPAFVNALLDTPAFEIEIAKNLGATINQITGYMFSKMEFAIPSSKEQIEIGKFFLNLDNLITLHQRKLDRMKALKKAFLNLIFSQKLRFRGFTESWELCKLGNIVEEYIEKTIIQNQYPVLTSSQQKGIVFQEDYFAGRQTTTDENIGYFVLPKGYFTYRSRSDNDIFVFNRNDLIDKGIISYFYPVFRVNDTDSNFFLWRVNNGIKRQVTIAAEGTGQHVLSLKKFKDIVTLFPTIEEQRRIGKFFSDLDHLITLQQNKIDSLKEVKKILLRNMLI